MGYSVVFLAGLAGYKRRGLRMGLAALGFDPEARNDKLVAR